MKRLFLFFLVLCGLQQSFVQAQAPVLTVPGGTTTFPSYATVNLDLQFTTPPAPCNGRVRAVLWYSSSNTANTGNHVSVTGATYGPSQLFSSYPTPFDANNSATTLIVGTQSSSTNMSFIVRTKEGVFCNNTTLRFTAKLYYYNASGVLCDSSVLSNPAVLTITAANNWTIQNEMQTAADDRCLNLPVRYHITVNHPANVQGSYNLTAPMGTFTVPAGAQILAVLNSANTPILFTLSGNGTVATFSMSAMTVLPTSGMIKHYYVIVRYPCGLFQLNTPINATAAYSGTNPCAAISTASSTTPVNFTVACCNQEPAGMLRKRRIGATHTLCPGHCTSAAYLIEFDNSQNVNAYPSLTITDNLPAEVNCSSFFTQVPAGSSCDLFYRFNNTPAGVWLGPLTLTAFTNTNVNTLPGWSAGLSLAGVRWRYTNFPAFTGISNQFNFTIFNNVAPGILVTNTATAVSATPQLNATASEDFTVQQCVPSITPRKYILDQNNSCVSTLLVNPGETVTYRIAVQNVGNGLLNNGTLSDALPAQLSLVPGTVRYYYGPTQCPAGNLLTPTITIPGSAAQVGFSATGQNLLWNNVNMPSGCSGINYFVVEFQVTVNAGTPSGPYPNQAVVSSVNGTQTWNSTVATINVADYLNINAFMEVACKGGAYVTDLKVKAGDPIRYRVTLHNQGNIAIHSAAVFNVRPQTGDLDAGCSGNCVQNARNSQFAVNSYTPFSAPPGYTTFRFPQMNCNSIICASGGVCTNNPLLTNPNSVGFRGSNTTIIGAGQTAVFEIDGIAGSGALGQMAFNDAGASAIRADNGQMITAVCSNLPKITLDSVGCGFCACGQWQYTRWEFLHTINGQPQWQSAAFECGNTLSPGLQPGNQYPFYYKYNCADNACAPNYIVSSDLPNNAYTTTVNNGQLTINYTPTATQCGKHNFTVTPVCGKDTCAPCPVYFAVECKDTCAEIVSDRIACDSLGFPVYYFCIRNNSTFTANTFKIKLPAGVGVSNVVPPAGVTYDGVMAGYHKFTYPAGLAPGNDLCTFQWRFTGVSAGQTVCMGVAIHQGTVPQYPVCCEDTTYQHCVTIPDCSNRCIDVLNPVMICGHGNIYYIQFKVKNNGLAELDRFVLQRVSPGLPADVFTYTFPTPLPNGQTSGTLTFTLNFSPLPGTTFCYRIRGYDMHYIAGELCVKDSCVGDLFCVTAPSCGKGEPGKDGLLAKGEQAAAVAETAQQSFMVFPNPSNGNMTLRYSVARGEKAVAEIWNLKGQLAKRLPLAAANGQQQEIRLEQLTPGAYLLKVSIDGKTAFKERIVILKR